MTVKIGLDLGYANYTVSDVTAGVYREPSVACVDRSGGRILSIGNEVQNGSETADGESLGQGILVRPFKNGLLYSSDITQEIIDRVIRAFQTEDREVRCFVGVPADFFPKQTDTFIGMIEKSGAKEVFAVDRAMAALIGAGYSPSISAISVNIGASHTELLTLHQGKILYSESAPIGGEDFDRVVKDYVAEQGDFNISLSVAKAIKEKLGAVWEGKPSESLTIEGTLSLTGSRVRMTMSTEDIVGVFKDPMTKLIRAVADAVKSIPAEAVPEIFANGIVLTGGGAELFGIGHLIGKVLGIRVTTPEDPIDCVARGLSRIGSFVPSRIKAGKNITADLSRYYEKKVAVKK